MLQMGVHILMNAVPFSFKQMKKILSLIQCMQTKFMDSNLTYEK